MGVTYTPPVNSLYDYYIVKKGDSLYAIANKYGITVNELKKLNNLSSDNLAIGMSLKIPKSSNEEVPDNNENETITYVVKKGDSLYAIANKYGMTVNELKDINNLKSNIISIGQVLKINKDTPKSEAVLTVVPGDTLYSIAKKYNVSVDSLKKANNKTSNLLSVGETLIIPNDNISNSKTYVVKPGDTLYSIAGRFNQTVAAIKKLNNLNSNLLNIGMILKIPD